jgi:diketogulonate reductase-like aldo/keto reductase
MSNQTDITLNNGVKMPVAGIGTFLLAPADAQASVLSALKDGYRLIDTANAYQNEKAVGRAIKLSGVPREEIFLETKLWPSFYEDDDAVEKTLPPALGHRLYRPAADPSARWELCGRVSPDGKGL